jgi:hypothetical protein
VEAFIVSRKHLIPVIAILIGLFPTITLAWRFEFYPEPTLLVIAHRLQPLHGFLYAEHYFKSRIIYHHTIQMVSMGQVHQISEVIVPQYFYFLHFSIFF